MYSIIPHTENTALRARSRPLSTEEIGGAYVAGLIEEMKLLLAQEEYGVALAAPQVGEAVQLFIVSGKAVTKRRSRYKEEPSDEMPGEDQVYINPSIVKMSRARIDKHEGCLSVRGRWGLVPRAEKLTLRYTDIRGVAQERGASGFLAHIFQHEMDHLEGILYIDKATELFDEKEENDE